MVDYTQEDWSSVLESLTKQAEFRGCSVSDAQDIAQEALFRTLVAVAKGKELLSLHSYAERVVTRLIIDAGLTRQRRKSVSLENILAAVDRGVDVPEPLISHDSPETILLDKEYAVQLERLQRFYAPMCADRRKSPQYRTRWRNRYRKAQRELAL